MRIGAQRKSVLFVCFVVFSFLSFFYGEFGEEAHSFAICCLEIYVNLKKNSLSIKTTSTLKKDLAFTHEISSRTPPHKKKGGLRTQCQLCNNITSWQHGWKIAYMWPSQLMWEPHELWLRYPELPSVTEFRACFGSWLVHGKRTKMGCSTLNGRCNGINIWSNCTIGSIWSDYFHNYSHAHECVRTRSIYFSKQKIKEYAKKRLHFLYRVIAQNPLNVSRFITSPQYFFHH